MPGSTPIYGFPYPLGSDPVKDGDNVIQSLATDVENIIAAQSPGLIKIETQVASVQTSLTFTAPFANTAAFSSFRIVGTGIIAPVGGTIRLQLANSGTPETDLNYAFQLVTFSGSTVTASSATAQNAWNLATYNPPNVFGASFIVDLINPNYPIATTGLGTSQALPGAGTIALQHYSLLNTEQNQYNGFVLTHSSVANFSGTFTVYGYSIF